MNRQLIGNFNAVKHSMQNPLMAVVWVEGCAATIMNVFVLARGMQHVCVSAAYHVAGCSWVRPSGAVDSSRSQGASGAQLGV